MTDFHRLKALIREYNSLQGAQSFLSLLAERGAFCFITSNSGLDVNFGKDLQEFFLRFGNLKIVIDNQKRRSFAHADVNTVIVLTGSPERKRPLSEQEMKERPIRFMAFRVPFEEAMSPVVFLEIEDESLYKPMAHFRVLRRPEFRVVFLDQWTLYQEGLEEDGKRLVQARRYAGNKWGGKYLRAPDIFFTILEKGKGKLVRLGDIAEVRFGIKTGANNFFYLQPVGRTVKEVAELREQDPMAPVRVRNGYGWEGEIEAKFLEPFLFSLKETESIRPNLNRFHRCAFVCRLSTKQLHKQGYLRALAYIQKFSKLQLKHGGKRLLPAVPSLRGRNPWYALPEQKPPHFISNRFIGDRFLFLEGGNFMVCEELGFSLCRKRGCDHPEYPYEHVHPEVLTLEQVKNASPDRFELDRVVFDVLGLTDKERLEVYQAVAELVKNRLVKARSV